MQQIVLLHCVVGALVVAVSALVRALVWRVIFFGFMPACLVKFEERQRQRAAGAMVARLEAKRVEDATFAELHRNPLVNLSFTFTEPLPVGVLAVLISTALLRRRRGEMAAGVGSGSTSLA